MRYLKITLDDLIKDTEPNIDKNNNFFFHGVNFYNLCYNANVDKKMEDINVRKYRSFIP